MAEKFCLKWNDFQENTIKTFAKLRNEDDFFDVTLVAEDQKQMMAHKIILSSCSDYFKNILKTNKHSHPILCLTGISSMDLENVLDYAYHGEVQIFQEDINKFLDIAQILKLDGLLASQAENEEQVEKHIMTNRSHELTANQESIGIIDIQKPSSTEMKGSQKDASVSTISVTGDSSVNEVEQKVLEYLGENEDGDYMCKLCGKADKSRYRGKRRIGHMKNHIETHLDGISFSCSLCGKQFRSRNSLNKHKSVYHKDKMYPMSRNK